MATKPSLPSFSWATDVTYSTGDPALIGSATKILPPVAESDEGWKANQKPPAQWVNYKDNWLTLLAEWVRLGSNTADIDPHIVETGADGVFRLAGGFFGGTAQSGSSVVDITPNTTGAGDSRGVLITMDNTVGIEVTANGAACIDATSSGATAAIVAQQDGTGPAISCDAGALGSAGISGDGGTSGDGVAGTGGSTSGAGVRGTSSVTSSAGIEGITTNTNGVAVRGTSAALAGSTSSAVRGNTGTGDATAVRGDSTAGDGYAGLFHADTTSPVRSALRLVPQDSLPSGTAGDGDIMVRDVGSDVKALMRMRSASAWPAMMMNIKGFAWAPLSFTAGPTVNNNSGVYTTGGTAQIAASGTSAPNETGIVWITVACGYGNNAGTVNTIDIRLRDVTAGVDIIPAETLDLQQAGPLTEGNYMRVVPYALPSVGVTRDIELQFKKTGGVGTGVQVTNVGIQILGVF